MSVRLQVEVPIGAQLTQIVSQESDVIRVAVSAVRAKMVRPFVVPMDGRIQVNAQQIVQM